MEFMNVVRMRVQPGKLDLWRERTWSSIQSLGPSDGLLEARIIQTGERDLCYVSRWRTAEDLAAARPKLVAALNAVRDLLESLGEIGLTDPVSGPVIVSH